jgi:hypothetical protein
MRNFEELGRELDRRGKTEEIKKLAASSDGMKISKMVDAKAVENAARSGDSEAIRRMLSAVLNTDEGKRLAENVRRMMQDN